jgi:hypothetical protein
VDNLRAAEAAAVKGCTDDTHLLKPLETFVDLVGEMAAMFPPTVFRQREIGA